MAAILASLAHAAPGQLDPTFGSGGRVVTALPSTEFVDLSVQADGKVVVVGTAGTGSVVARYLADGTLDPSFGTGGFVTLADRAAGGVVVHPDGIVIAGVPSTPARAFFLMRLQLDGSIDAGFGSGGVVTESGIIAIGGSELQHPALSVCNGAVFVAADGDIVVGVGIDLGGGYVGAGALRYQASGAPEPSFLGSEYVAMSVSPVRRGLGVAPFGGTCSDVALDGAGGIVLGGTGLVIITPMTIGTQASFGRLNADDGQVDTAFGGGDGVIAVWDGVVPPSTSAHAVGGDGTGRLLLSDSRLRRYTAAGVGDASFDGESTPSAFVVDAAGRILDLRDFSFGVGRLLEDGARDPGFGVDGLAATSFVGWPSTVAIALAEDANGNIVVGGRLRATAVSDDGFALARFRGGEVGASTPLAGKALTLKSSANPASKRLSLTSVDSLVDLGHGPDSIDDPRIEGATLRIRSDAGIPFDATYDMPASAWSAIVKRGEVAGWQYRGAEGAVRSAKIEAGRRLKVVARGAELTHDLAANPDPVVVTLRVGEHATCFAFGGQVRFSAGRSYAAKAAPPPASCE